MIIFHDFGLLESALLTQLCHHHMNQGFKCTFIVMLCINRTYYVMMTMDRGNSVSASNMHD